MSISMFISDFWRNLTKGMLFTTQTDILCSVLVTGIFLRFLIRICYVFTVSISPLCKLPNLQSGYLFLNILQYLFGITNQKHHYFYPYLHS